MYIVTLISAIFVLIFSQEQFQLRALYGSSNAVRVGWDVFDVHNYMRSTEIV